MKSLKLVIVDDERAHFELMRRSICREFPFASIEHFCESASCLEAIDRIMPDLILVDYLMPGMNGIEFLKRLRPRHKDMPIIMITGQGDEGIAVKALKEGASDYLVKAPDFFTLLPGIIEKAIRERKLKNSLREFERRFRDLAESTSDWIWELDAEGRYTYSNPAVENITGYHPGEIIGVRFEDFFPENKKRAQRKTALQLMREGKPISGYTSCIVDRHGREVFLETSGVPIFDPLHTLLGYRGIDRNVTRRMRGEQALRESEERFRMIYEKSPIGIELYDECGLLVNANRASLDIFGISYVSDLKRYNLFDDPSIPEEALDRLCKGETVRYEAPFSFDRARELELFKTERSGSIHIDVQITPLMKDGWISGYLLQVQDVTMRRRAEESIRISHRFLELANRSTGLSRLLSEFISEVKQSTGCAAAGIRLLDEKGNIPYEAYDGFSRGFYESESPLSIVSDHCWCINVIRGMGEPNLLFYTKAGSFYMNGTTRFLATVSEEEKGRTRNVCNLFGYESIALVPIRLGDAILGLIHIADPKENMAPLEIVEMLERAAMELGTAIQRVHAAEALRRARDELELRVAERTLELASANKRLQIEVEERKRAQETLHKSSEDLKLFAYSVMHDLKSPSVGIHGLTRLLMKQYAGNLDERGKRYCEQILKASEYNAAMVEQINTYIAGKEAPLVIEPVILNQIFEVIREEFAARLRLRRVQWIEPEERLVIRADRLSMLRVFRNLVDNALKYGGDDLSELRIQYRETEEFHIFSVSDDGIGIKKEDCETIFRPFKRNGDSKGISGAGLGLNIVREIAERHCGRVWAEPRSPRGTSFHVSIAKKL